LRGLNDFRLVATLLVRVHQLFQRLFLHHSVRVLREKGLEAADLGRRILLPESTDVRVVFGGVLDLFFLLRCSRGGRGVLRCGGGAGFWGVEVAGFCGAGAGVV